MVDWLQDDYAWSLGFVVWVHMCDNKWWIINKITNNW